jgi:acyl-coenzyme A thioesterase PaaI-like protein
VKPAGPLFTPDGAAGAFAPAPAARGPWDPAMMHGGAPAALLARAIEACEPAEGLAVTRLTVEFLSAVPLGPVAVAAEVAKPGRRFQIVEATLRAGDRTACLARAVRLRRADQPGARAAAPGAPPLPPPEAGEDLPRFVGGDAEMFHPDAVQIRQVGGELGSGALAAWLRVRGELVPGEAPSPLARVAAAADFTNGLSWILPWEDWTFVNTELTIHLHREPEGEWIGLDARTHVGGTGAGLATGTLHDRRGPVGACAQALFVQPR